MGAWVIRDSNGTVLVVVQDRQLAEKLLQPGHDLTWEELELRA